MQSKNDKYKYLSKNLILFAISSIGSKLIGFFLIPLYTNFLTTAEYGLIDLIDTIRSITIPVFTLCLESAVLRFCFDKEYNKNEIFTASLHIWIRSHIFNGLFILVCYLGHIFDKYENFLLYYLLIYICVSIKDVLTSFYRGADHVNVMMETSLISALSMCGLNILLLTVLKLNVFGYILAYAISSAITILWGTIRIHIKKYAKKCTLNKKLIRELQSYGAPLIFNQIGWWLNNSVDKYVVIYYLGLSQNGIYSIAYRIPSILSVLSSIFANAWSLSAIKEYEADDVDEFSSKMYALYNAFLVLGCSVLLLFNYPIAKFLFAKEFFDAWKISGILIISSIFNGLAGFIGSFFSAAKDTKSYATSTIFGGVINVILSIVLVNSIGLYGVAIGTLISHIAIWIVRLIKSRKYVKIRVPIFHNSIMYILLVVECGIGLFGFQFWNICAQMLVVLILILMNYKNIIMLLSKIKTKIIGGKSNGKASN